MTASSSGEEVGLLVEHHQAACHIILDRPRVLNALSIAMKETLAAALPGLARDAEIYALVIKSASSRAFCVGGDVKELAQLAATDMNAARRCLADEYRLNWLLECFFKPTVALVDGAVMGSGVGLTQYGTHLVAGENYRFAMPETSIGFFPDVGMAHKLARLPHSFGTYLALTGRTISRADAYAVGLVTHCIDASAFPEIEAELADAQPIDPLLDSRHQAPGGGELKPYFELIATIFSKPTLSEIFSEAAAQCAKGTDQERGWCKELLAELEQKSPIAMQVTLQHVRRALHRDLRETLITDYHLACRFIEVADFKEGVRAVLVEKTKDPIWQHRTVDDVSADEVNAYFEAGDEPEFSLPTKEQVEFI